MEIITDNLVQLNNKYGLNLKKWYFKLSLHNISELYNYSIL